MLYKLIKNKKMKTSGSTSPNTQRKPLNKMRRLRAVAGVALMSALPLAGDVQPSVNKEPALVARVGEGRLLGIEETATLVGGFMSKIKDYCDQYPDFCTTTANGDEIVHEIRIGSKTTLQFGGNQEMRGFKVHQDQDKNDIRLLVVVLNADSSIASITNRTLQGDREDWLEYTPERGVGGSYNEPGRYAVNMNPPEENIFLGSVGETIDKLEASLFPAVDNRPR